eukprot:m51a1_g2851 putative condensin complex subunit 3 (1043) ;mRNA; r:299909-303821
MSEPRGQQQQQQQQQREGRRNAVARVLGEYQASAVSRSAALERLLALRRSPSFARDLGEAVDSLLAVWRTDEPVQRVAALTAQLAGAVEPPEAVAVPLLRRLARSCGARDRAVRLRSVHLIGLVLDELPPAYEINEELYSQLSEALLERVRDKVAAIRVQTTHALQRMQPEEEEDPSDPVERAFTFLMTDPSPEVRRAALECRMVKFKKSVSDVRKRTRDVDDGIRAAAYAKLGACVDVRSLCASHLRDLARNGLRDRSKAVRAAATALVCEHWLQSMSNDPVQLLGALGPDDDADESGSSASEMVAKCIVENVRDARKPRDLVGGAASDPEVRPEEVLFWRVYAEHATKRNEMDAPELPAVASLISERMLDTFFCRQMLKESLCMSPRTDNSAVESALEVLELLYQTAGEFVSFVVSALQSDALQAGPDDTILLTRRAVLSQYLLRLGSCAGEHDSMVMATVALPCIANAMPDVRVQGVRVYALVLLRRDAVSEPDLIILRRILENDSHDVQQAAVMAAVDLIGVFGPDKVQVAGEPLLRPVLDRVDVAEEPGLRYTATVGVAKLLFSGTVADPEALGRLASLLCNPQVEKGDSRLCQCLSLFFLNFFSQPNPAREEMLRQSLFTALECGLRNGTEAKQLSPLYARMCPGVASLCAEHLARSILARWDEPGGLARSCAAMLAELRLSGDDQRAVTATRVVLHRVNEVVRDKQVTKLTRAIEAELRKIDRGEVAESDVPLPDIPERPRAGASDESSACGSHGATSADAILISSGSSELKSEEDDGSSGRRRRRPARAAKKTRRPAGTSSDESAPEPSADSNVDEDDDDGDESWKPKKPAKILVVVSSSGSEPEDQTPSQDSDRPAKPRRAAKTPRKPSAAAEQHSESQGEDERPRRPRRAAALKAQKVVQRIARQERSREVVPSPALEVPSDDEEVALEDVSSDGGGEGQVPKENESLVANAPHVVSDPVPLHDPAISSDDVPLEDVSDDSEDQAHESGEQRLCCATTSEDRKVQAIVQDVANVLRAHEVPALTRRHKPRSK